MTLPLPEAQEFRGRCPICSAKLRVDGKFVECTEQSHYRIEEAIFAKAWDSFADKLKDLGANPIPVSDINTLMKSLIEGNKAVGGSTIYTADGKIK